MPSREALHLAEQTGCLPAEAAAALAAEADSAAAAAAVASIMAFRRQRYAPQLEREWARLAGAADAPELDIDQTIGFVQQLGLQLEDPVVLALAYELQAPRMGAFQRAGFVDGWARLEAGGLREMREAALPQLRARLTADKAYFREVYRFTFRFCLGDGGRLLPVDAARAYWQLLLEPRYPEIARRWIAYADAAMPAVSSDTWNMVLEFFEYATHKDPTLANYDETSAWPRAIDEFVEHLAGPERTSA